MTSNHIEEYFTNNENTIGSELFRVQADNVDIKTEITDDEIKLINTLMENDVFLNSRKLRTPFERYLIGYMRLKISKDRQGRSEFVKINQRGQDEDSIMNRLGNMSNIVGVRK